MTQNEMNRRIATVRNEKIEQVKRLLKNGYNARDIYNFRIGVKLAQINAIEQMVNA